MLWDLAELEPGGTAAVTGSSPRAVCAITEDAISILFNQQHFEDREIR